VERREQLLEEFGRSGLSGPKFAQLVGVKYQTFAGWMHERRKKGAVASTLAPSSLRLVEAVVACETKERTDNVTPGSQVLQVHLGDGVRIEIGDTAQLKLAVSLMRALGVQRPC
jgi:hypothetical protein